jgi:hypothetical protein
LDSGWSFGLDSLEESALPLLLARVFLVDDVDATLTADYLAVCGAALNGGPDFHKIFS